MSSSIINLAIADDHNLVRTRLTTLLTLSGNYKFVIEAKDGQELLNKLHKCQSLPHICIIDINMPVLNGYDTLIQLRQQYPNIKTLTLTFDETDYNIIRMFKAGTNGYLFKSSSAEEFHTALEHIYEYGFYCPDIIKQKLDIKQGRMH